MRHHPHLYELNAFAFVSGLRKDVCPRSSSLPLSKVPREYWQKIRGRGADLVWLMGVWKRSPKAKEAALNYPALRHAYNEALPGWEEKDVTGSPYAVYSYTPDPYLGSEEDFRKLKQTLNRLGLGLILDFVPNHLALDHPWTRTNPDRFLRGTEESFRFHPDWFFKTEGGIYLAHGRDPYFPPWSDTVQVNFFSLDGREALIQELLKVAGLCDGVRCDMAMLGLNHVFEYVWGEFLRGVVRPQREFWEEAIGAVRKQYPGFVFIAEAYWDLEWKLQQTGFDFTYDKRLYDRLLHSNAEDVRGHLRAEMAYQKKSVRFIENHDERRATVAFGPEKSKAAAVVAATVPGMRFFHDGQFEGKSIHLPIQLGREAEEKVDEQALAFYKHLICYTGEELLHQGEWVLIDPLPVEEGNGSHRDILSWLWHDEKRMGLVAVNYSAAQARARLPLPKRWHLKRGLVFRDEMTGRTYPYSASEISSRGIFVDLAPWQVHLFQWV